MEDVDHCVWCGPSLCPVSIWAGAGGGCPWLWAVPRLGEHAVVSEGDIFVWHGDSRCSPRIRRWSVGDGVLILTRPLDLFRADLNADAAKGGGVKDREFSAEMQITVVNIVVVFLRFGLSSSLTFFCFFSLTTKQSYNDA